MFFRVKYTYEQKQEKVTEWVYWRMLYGRTATALKAYTFVNFRINELNEILKKE